MIEITSEKLSNHTTVRIGGIAERYLIPESLDELKDVISANKDYRIIGGGSNLLISDRSFPLVIDLGKVDNNIEKLDDELYKVGASVRLQKLINTINEDGKGGIEYLYSVPGLVGGAIVMNAGRGKSYGKSIGDFVVSVDALVEGQIKSFSKQDCMFAYRNSVFKNSNMVIVSTIFAFPDMSNEETTQLKKKRIEYSKSIQDNSAPNFGSVFCESNPMIMKIVCKLGLSVGNISFSKKTKNWILNNGGEYEDAIKLIQRIELLHKLLGKKCRREIITWD